MRLLVRIVALGVVAFLFATPMMACVMEAASLTITEAACCQAMKGDCHSSVGPASHKCCRTITTVPDASKPTRSVDVAQAQVAVMIVSAIGPARATTNAPTFSSDSSPPGSPPALHSTLRI
jgi:hypothetical protein